jgi:hypothetical protein
MQYRFRYYSSTLGRFMTRDPLAAQRRADLYAYAGARPLGKPDPMGLRTVEVGNPRLPHSFGVWAGPSLAMVRAIIANTKITADTRASVSAARRLLPMVIVGTTWIEYDTSGRAVFGEGIARCSSPEQWGPWHHPKTPLSSRPLPDERTEGGLGEPDMCTLMDCLCEHHTVDGRKTESRWIGRVKVADPGGVGGPFCYCEIEYVEIFGVPLLFLPTYRVCVWTCDQYEMERVHGTCDALCAALNP